MLKAMLLSYDSTQLEREDLTKLIDACGDVVNWTTALTSSMILITEKTTQDISQYIIANREKPFRYILVTVTERSGLLPQDTWDFIKNPKAVL